jgi:hypothetical protein
MIREKTDAFLDRASARGNARGSLLALKQPVRVRLAGASAATSARDASHPKPGRAGFPTAPTLRMISEGAADVEPIRKNEPPQRSCRLQKIPDNIRRIG